MELTIRVLSALVLAPAMLAIVWFANDMQYIAFVALLAAVGGWEWGRLAGSRSAAFRALLALLVAGAVAALAGLAAEQATTVLLALGIAAWLLNYCWLSRPQFLSSPDGAPMLAKTLLGIVVLTTAAFSLARVHQAESGNLLTIVFLLIIWAADVGAYAAGRLFGRRKLAPSISPGKTWEGVLGGQVLVALVIGLLLRYLPQDLGLGNWLFALAALIAAVSVVGDLFISVLKRQRKLKDTGRVVPGHGGVLDRFDSAFAAAPFFLGGLLLARHL